MHSLKKRFPFSAAAVVCAPPLQNITTAEGPQGVPLFGSTCSQDASGPFSTSPRHSSLRSESIRLVPLRCPLPGRPHETLTHLRLESLPPSPACSSRIACRAATTTRPSFRWRSRLGRRTRAASTSATRTLKWRKMCPARAGSPALALPYDLAGAGDRLVNATVQSFRLRVEGKMERMLSRLFDAIAVVADNHQRTRLPR